MVCIYCGSATEVSNSRRKQRHNEVWRRRTCKACGAIFTTTESASLDDSIMVVKDGKFTPFSRERLFVSIYSSCKHRKSAVKDAGALTDTVVSKLLSKAKSASVTSEDIIDSVMSTLKRFDEAAAVQYTAFHPLNQRISIG